MGQLLPSQNNIWTFNIRFKLRARECVEKDVVPVVVVVIPGSRPAGLLASGTPLSGG